MNKRLEEELKKFEKSLERRRKLGRAAIMANYLYASPEESLKDYSNGRWTIEDVN